MDLNTVKQRMQNALEELKQTDAYLFANDLNERTFTAKLCGYVQKEFPEYNVDAEYNRNMKGTKSLLYFNDVEVSPLDTEARTVYPDLIVHERGSNNRNLLVIETKKTTSTLDQKLDFQKLRDFKSDPKYKYTFALFLLIEIGDSPEVKMTWL